MIAFLSRTESQNLHSGEKSAEKTRPPFGHE
jgi:hypothetical protein